MPATQRIQPERLIELEAVRGIAAVVVLFHHCLLGFLPTVSGLVVPAQPWSLFGTPFFAFLNGTAAVALFFVLSGFVLTYQAIDSATPRLLALATLRRWPRLAFPVLIVNLGAGALFALGLYANIAADTPTGSIWLAWMYRTNPYPAPAVLAAAYEGTVATFLFGTAAFNSSLWTMYYEFFGSFLAFALAYLLIGARMPYLLAAAVLAVIACWYVNAYAFCFVAGVALAATRHRLHALFMHQAVRRGWIAGVGLAVAFLLFGYHEHIPPGPLGFYEFLAPVAKAAPHALRVTLHTAGAVIVLIVALEYGHRLRGPFASFLGQISFPIYLLHIPVLCSAGCAIYLVLLPAAGHPLAAIAAIVVTMAVTFALAIPLGRVDRLWLALLRRAVALRPRAPAASPAE